MSTNMWDGKFHTICEVHPYIPFVGREKKYHFLSPIALMFGAQFKRPRFPILIVLVCEDHGDSSPCVGIIIC